MAPLDHNTSGKAEQPLSPENPPEHLGCLVVLNGSALGRLFPLTQPHQILGSHVNVPISLTDPGVSPKHAEFRFDGKNLTFIALDQTAESYVNGKPVESCVLTPGDRIQVGTIATLKYTEVTK